MKLVIVNLKSDTGKITTAVYLALGLAQHGRTLLIDADPQGSSLSWSEGAKDFPVPVIGLPVKDLHKRVAQSLIYGVQGALTKRKLQAPGRDRVYGPG